MAGIPSVARNTGHLNQRERASDDRARYTEMVSMCLDFFKVWPPA